MKLCNTILIVITLIVNNSANYCGDDFAMGDFPDGVLANIFSIISGKIVFSDCTKIVVDSNNVNLWYWTRQNVETPILLDKYNPSQLNLEKPTIILVPGWLCNVTNDRMPELRKAYLEKYDCNVIGIDWSYYSIDTYGNSHCAAPLIGKMIGKFLCTSKLDLSRVHVVGHSMGGQVAGFIGSEVQKQCIKKIFRITGLDPAGPLYQSQSPDIRLDETDASFVDVIHTNQGQFGYSGTCGTSDFFPNCGVIQPGCMNLTSITNLPNLPLQTVNCNHLRSVDYMVESIRSNNFVAKSSKLAPTLCISDFISGTTAIMGEGWVPTNDGRKYVLKTNKQSPYAQG